MGLLGDSWEDPRTAAILNLAGGLLSQRNLGAGLVQGMQGYSSSMLAAKKAQQEEEERKAVLAQRAAQELRAQQQFVLQQQLGGLQVNEAARAAAEREAQAARDDQFRSSIPSPRTAALQALGADASPTAANAARMPQVDPRSQFLFDALQARQIKPMDYLTATKPKEPEFKVVGDSLVQIGGGRVSEAYRAPTKPEAAPAAVREYQFAKDQGYQGTFQQFQLEQRRAGASNLNVNTGDNKFEAKAGEVIANQFAETYKQGQGAVRALGQVNRLDQLLQKTGGGFTPAVKMYAGQFGVNTSGLDDIQAAEAIIQSLIPQQRPVGSGTMSDKDVDLFRQSLPRLINQPGGNQKIISTMRGLYEYDQKLGKIASDALAGKISRERAMQLMNDVPNPLAYLTSGSDVRSQADAIINGGRP
jgi:flagellar protein FlgJ